MKIYQIFMGGFAKDLKDLKNKLWYVKYLGFNAILLSPIFKSPTYHKYDTTDYYTIDPQFGTEDDFNDLLKEIESLDLNIIMDFVLCHTSINHKWFKDCVEGKNDFYTLKNTKDDIDNSYPTPMSNFSWDYSNEYKTWYLTPWHNEMPSLNVHSESLKSEIEYILHYWLSKSKRIHVRLDAILYCDLVGREPLEYCNWIRRICERINPNISIIGEVWDNHDTVQSFSDVLGSCFSFDDCAKIKEKVWSGENKYNQVGSEDLTYFIGNHDMSRLSNNMNMDFYKVKKAVDMLYSTKAKHISWYYGDEVMACGIAHYNSPIGHTEVRQPLDWSDIHRRMNEQDSLLNYIKNKNRTV